MGPAQNLIRWLLLLFLIRTSTYPLVCFLSKKESSLIRLLMAGEVAQLEYLIFPNFDAFLLLE